jgi:hypothetical protein
MSRRTILCLLLVAAVPVVWRGARAADDSLRQALVAHGLTPDESIIKNLDKKITSGAELDDASQYVIAYYVDDGSGLLNPPLFLERFDRKHTEWKSASLPEAHAKSEGLDDICYGSVLRITASGGRFFLETHINPSAGCVLVLSYDLKFQTSLFGWLLGHLGEDAMIYHRSQVHFAPVHPAELAMYDLRTKRDVPLFPRKPDSPIRRARTAQLAEFYKANPEWCTKNDDPCDPEEFDSELQGPVATNEAEAALAFLISYEQIQMVQGDVQKPSGPKDVLYVYRGVKDETKMEYRELLLQDAKARFGATKLEDFTQPEILQKIFSEAPAK